MKLKKCTLCFLAATLLLLCLILTACAGSDGGIIADPSDSGTRVDHASGNDIVGGNDNIGESGIVGENGAVGGNDAAGDNIIGGTDAFGADGTTTPGNMFGGSGAPNANGSTNASDDTRAEGFRMNPVK